MEATYIHTLDNIWTVWLLNIVTDIFSRVVGYITSFDKPEVVLKIAVEKCQFQKQKTDFPTQCFKETKHYMSHSTIEYF